MNHWEIENAVALGVALKEAGFQVSQICCSRLSCFDFAARKNSRLVLVKVCSEVDTFSLNDSRELKVIAERVGAASLVVSQRTHEKMLEDDTVYSRNGILVVTAKTLRNVALRKAFPLIYADPGGYSVEVEGALVERRRKELGFSMGQLAELVGVTRRTLYGYERGMAKACVASAYNLAKILGVPVAKPIDILRSMPKQRQCLLRKNRQAQAERKLFEKVFQRFASCDVSLVTKAPFDFVVNIQEGQLVILGGVAVCGEKYLEERAEEILSLSQVIGAYPVLVTEQVQPSIKKILCVGSEELEGCSVEDLAAKV